MQQRQELKVIAALALSDTNMSETHVNYPPTNKSHNLTESQKAATTHNRWEPNVTPVDVRRIRCSGHFEWIPAVMSRSAKSSFLNFLGLAAGGKA